MRRLIDILEGWAQKFTLSVLSLTNTKPETIEKVKDAFINKNEAAIQTDKEISESLKHNISLYQILFYIALGFVGYLLIKTFLSTRGKGLIKFS